MVLRIQSKFDYCWQYTHLLIYIYLGIMLPLSVAFSITEFSLSYLIEAIIVVVFVYDIFYQRKIRKSDHIQTETQKQVKGFIDIFTAIPFDFLAYQLIHLIGNKFYFGIRFLRFLKLKSSKDMFTKISHFQKILIITASAFIAIHWISCFWIVLNHFDLTDPITVYNKAVYWTVTTVGTVGYGDITPQDNITRLYAVFVMLIGVAMYGLIVGNISQIIYQKNKFEEETKRKLDDLNIFLSHYKIPEKLQVETYNFYNHLLNKRMSELDDKILSELPTALQKELQVYMSIKMISDLSAFKNLSHDCLKEIALKLEHQFFAPNEQIIKTGTQGMEMYIIGHGHVDIIVGDAVVATLNPGQFFGEIALLQETTRTADVFSKHYSDLYVLKKDSFNELIKNYPELKRNLESITSKRPGDKKK